MINKKYWYFEVMVFALILLVIIPFVRVTASINLDPPPTPGPPPVTATNTPIPPPTQTLIPSRTPQPTRTPLPTPVPKHDLIADSLEVTQAIQDLNNSVRLVAGKRTIVRFHVFDLENPSTEAVATARLHVQRGTNGTWLDPLNHNGEITVLPEPDRSILHHAFTFELPSEYTHGTITLTAELNPRNPATENRDVKEKDYSNNTVSVENLTFEDVPVPNVVLYRVEYQLDGVTYQVSLNEVQMIYEWLLRVFSINNLSMDIRTHKIGEGKVGADGMLVKPDCNGINEELFINWIGDELDGSISEDTRYYGLWSDGKGYPSIGCAQAVTSEVASGPTGHPVKFYPWDTDNTYGDHLTAHELGHAYGREHVGGPGSGSATGLCGTEGDPDPNYPHPGGTIGIDLFFEEAFYGFDYGTWTIYDTFSYDFMTYCDNLWISDYTYHALMDVFQKKTGRYACKSSCWQSN